MLQYKAEILINTRDLIQSIHIINTLRTSFGMFVMEFRSTISYLYIFECPQMNDVQFKLSKWFD